VKSPRRRRNPQWTNDILSSYWQRIDEAVGREMMPIVQGSRSRLVAKEFGSGAYGTVLPTASENIVMKITTDKSEASFAAMLLGLPEMPEGVVRYFDAYALQAHHDGDRIYALWREEAFNVGHALSWDEARALHLYVDAAEVVYWDRDRSSIARAALLAEEMENRGGNLRAIGATLRWFLSIGVLVADVHSGNVGLVKRFGECVAVITDPGHTVFLKKRARTKPPLLR
jgi:hypothetical protein